MSKQIINLGNAPSGQGGDTPRSANVKIGANFDELYTALGATGNPQALPAALPISKGGTGGTTAALARTGLGLGNAAVAAVVGDVGAGALMYYVSTSTGELWMFQSGLAISSQTVLVPNGFAWSAGSASRYCNSTASLPFTFAATPKFYCQVLDSDISGRSAWCTYITGTINTISAWFASPLVSNSSNGFSYSILAVGRWK